MFSRNRSSRGKIPDDTSPHAKAQRTQARIEKRRRFWRKARRGLLWFLVVAFVAHLSLNIYASVQLNREFAAIRQKGDPLRFSEVEPPSVPAAQNAALVYQQATKSLHFSPDEKSAMDARQRDLTPSQEKLIKQALRENKRALVLTRQAASMPQCRFPLDWKSDPLKFRFPYYAELRELARLVALDARMKAQSGQRDIALSDVRALFGMSHHLSNERTLIGFLVAQAVDSIAHRALGQTLDNIPLTNAQARELEASLPQSDWTRVYRQCLVGERMFGIAAFQTLGQTKQGNSDSDDVSYLPTWANYPLLWVARPVLKMDLVQTLRTWHLFLDTPASQQVPRPQDFDRAQDKAIQHAPFYAALTKILFPVFSRASDSRDFAEVRRRQREIALALVCYRTAKGYYPANLQEAAALWGKPLPVDIYSQKPFVYRRTGKGFLLYSVGVNRVDDGGLGPYSRGRKLNFSADDVVWLNSQEPPASGSP